MARTERVDNQAEDKAPAVRTASRPNPEVREEDAVDAVPARVKDRAAVVDKDRAGARDVVAVKIVKRMSRND